MTYARLEDSFRRNPKIIRLARTLGIRRAEARGLLAGLWSETLILAPDGDVSDLDPVEIEERADWEGEPGKFFAAIQDERHRFVDRKRGKLVIHDWDQHAEGLKRAAWKRAERERKEKTQLSATSRDKDATDAPSRAPGSDLIREERIREEERGGDQAPAQLEVVMDLWDKHAVFAKTDRPPPPLVIRLFKERMAVHAKRVRIEFWEEAIRHACVKAKFLRKKSPPTTIEWFLSVDREGAENLQRVLDGAFDRDFDSKDNVPAKKTKEW